MSDKEKRSTCKICGIAITNNKPGRGRKRHRCDTCESHYQRIYMRNAKRRERSKCEVCGTFVPSVVSERGRIEKRCDDCAKIADQYNEFVPSL